MMKHTFNISIAALTVAAMSLLVAGCQKQNVQGDGTAYPLSFEINVGSPEIDVLAGNGTKADNRKTGTSTIENFTVAGYTDSAEWFPQTTVNTSSMTFSDKLWMPGETHTFYAYANLPGSGANATIASDGVTLTYTDVPTTQASQQDILLGSYSGTGANGKASIQFYHPLAAMAFKVGTISGVTAIKSITLDGAYKSGNVTLSETSGTPVFAWTASTTQNGVNQTGLNVTTFTSNTKIGDPFILIPQTFSSKPLTVKIALTTAEGDKTVTATLNIGSIAAGKTTTYAINYDGDKGLNFSNPDVIEWGTGDGMTAELEERQLPNGALPGIFSVGKNVQAYFSRGNLCAKYNATTNTYTWDFAECQYDYVGNNPGNNRIGNLQDGDIVDLFGWSTDGATFEYGISASTNYKDYAGNFVDWGFAYCNSKLIPQTTWRTPSSGEWSYLINSRTGSTIGTVANARYAKIQIGEIPGLLLFPDSFAWDSSTMGIIPSNINMKKETWKNNVYTLDNFYHMESEGAVFLPISGQRNGTSCSNDITRYFSSDIYNQEYPYCVLITDDDLNPARTGTQKNIGLPVRLISIIGN